MLHELTRPVDLDRWEHFRNVGGIGVRGVGLTLEAAFDRAAYALAAVIADPATIRAVAPIALSCSARSDPDLLYEWLNAVAVAMAERQMLFQRFKVRIHGGHLRAVAWGEPMDAAHQRRAAEVKSADLRDVRVERDTRGQWVAEAIIDA